MTYELNEKLKCLVPYDAVAGEYRIRLDANESFIDPGELYGEEFLTAVSGIRFNRYPDPMATELCKKFAECYQVDPACVVAGNGSDELIAVIMGAFLRPGDRILSFSPDFSMYQFYGEIYEKFNCIAEKRKNLTLTAEEVLHAARENEPAAIIISNPCSPTSLVMSREDILQIVENAGTLVMIDEAYMDFSNQSVLETAEQYDNLIVLKTCSKAWGMAAIRLGFAVSSKAIIRALHCVRSPYNVNALTQAIGSVILSHPEYIRESVEEIKKPGMTLSEVAKIRRSTGVRRIIRPETNFVYMELADAGAVYDELKKRSVIVRRMGDFLRITAGKEEEHEGLIRALSEIV